MEVGVGPDRGKLFAADRIPVGCAGGVDGVAYRGQFAAIWIYGALARPGHVENFLMRITRRVRPAFHDLNSIEVAAVRIADRPDREPWRLVLAGAQVPTHGDACTLCLRYPILLLQQIRCIIPAGEKAHRDAGARGGVSLLALHGIEDRLACILRGPHSLITGGSQFIAFNGAEL